MNPEELTRASTLIHSVHGAALLVLAAGGLVSLKRPGSRALTAGYFALLASAAAGPLVLLALPGGWSPEGLSQALAFRPGMALFVGLSCLLGAAGLSGLMAERPARPVAWRWLAPAFLLLAGALYAFLPLRAHPDARSFSLAAHVSIGGLLALAAFSEAGFLRFGRTSLRAAAFSLILLSAGGLLSYREKEEAYGPRYVTMTASPGPLPAAAPAKNAAADKKRARN